MTVSDNNDLREDILTAWIGLNNNLKNSRVTKDMSYNEAVVMRIVLRKYREDGIGLVAIQTIIKETAMLKSLVNRTINMLCDKGYLLKQRDSKDARNVSVYPIEDKLEEFERIHTQSLQIAQKIIDVIGEDDAGQFVRIYRKLEESLLIITE